MKKFRYVGIGRDGKKITDILEARDLYEAKRLLMLKKVTLIKINETNIKSKKNKKFLKRKKLKTSEVSHFCRQFSIILSSGVNSILGLETLGKKDTNTVLNQEIVRMVVDIKTGSTIAETMGARGSKFPKLLSSMVATGETTGKLDEVLKSMADFYGKEHRIRQKIKSATTYPIIVLMLCAFMLVFFTAYMIPKMMESITMVGAELPLITEIVMNVGEFMSKNWMYVVLGMFLMIIIIGRYIKTPVGRMHKDKLINRIPLLGKAINCMVAMRFSRALHLFVSTGCSILQGLEQIIDSVGNSLAERTLKQAREGIIKGESLAENLDKSKYFDPVLIQMISIGEQTGELEVITAQMAQFYEEESDVYINRLVAMIEPLLIIFVGILVLTLVAAIFLPMISMYDAI